MSRYNSTFNWKIVVGILIGIVVAVGIACLTIAIGCAVNGVSFSQQIVNWFGTEKTQQVNALQEAVVTTACKFVA